MTVLGGVNQKRRHGDYFATSSTSGGWIDCYSECPGGQTQFTNMKTCLITLAIVASALTVSNAEPDLEKQVARELASPEKLAVKLEKKAARELKKSLEIAEPSGSNNNQARREGKREEKDQKEAAVRQQRIDKQIKDTIASEFEEKNSELDLMRAKLTYAVQQPDGNYTAYLHIRWGDLDKHIHQNGSVYYSNWDGNLKLEQGGNATVVKEYAFDDRDGTTGGVDDPDGLGRDSGKKPSGKNQPGQGSGRDAIIRDDSPIVAWKSGVVGATDGLLLLLDLRQAETRGTLKLGNFTIPFVTQLRPAVGP